MDGSKRKTLIGEKLGYPSGLVVDFEGGHRVYWADMKLNTIESVNPDGSNRVTVIHGDLHHPASLDLFEDQLYWVTRDTGEIFKQDKFGRGVKVRVKRSLEQASDLKIYHDKKYNTSCKLFANIRLLLTVPTLTFVFLFSSSAQLLSRESLQSSMFARARWTQVLLSGWAWAQSCLQRQVQCRL